MGMAISAEEGLVPDVAGLANTSALGAGPVRCALVMILQWQFRPDPTKHAPGLEAACCDIGQGRDSAPPGAQLKGRAFSCSNVKKGIILPAPALRGRNCRNPTLHCLAASTTARGAIKP